MIRQRDREILERSVHAIADRARDAYGLVGELHEAGFGPDLSPDAGHEAPWDDYRPGDPDRWKLHDRAITKTTPPLAGEGRRSERRPQPSVRLDKHHKTLIAPRYLTPEMIPLA
jgi:hypothetical protein